MPTHPKCSLCTPGPILIVTDDEIVTPPVTTLQDTENGESIKSGASNWTYTCPYCSNSTITSNPPGEEEEFLPVP